MAKLVIQGGKPLFGTVEASGAKNAALPLMAASLLSTGDVVLERIPNITDVHVMIELLRYLGASIEYDGKSVMRINCSRVRQTKAPYELVKKIHASFDIAGPLLARFHEAQVPLPGGCVLGYRGVNFHLDGFQTLGAQVALEHGYVCLNTDKLIGTKVYVGRASVGATKNIMMAACMAEGTTYLENIAREPEVTDLAYFLNALGGKISGIGSDKLTIEGVSNLSGTTYRIISDRIEAGTYLIAGAITGGEVTVTNIQSHMLEPLLSKLEETGAVVTRTPLAITVKRGEVLSAVDHIMTAPYPGFPTDLQAPFVALLTIAIGISMVEETIFDGRFSYVPELERMGADVRIADRTAIVKGVESLTGAPVEAPDIRAGGSLVLAGLAAKGQTEVGGVEYIDRGYEKIEEKFSMLGADIKRVF